MHLFLRYSIYLFLFINVIVLHTSCKGCSRSGQRNRARATTERNRFSKKQDQEEKVESPIEVKKKEIIDVKNRQEPIYKKTVSQLFKELEKSVFMVYAFNEKETSGGQGSGFFIAEDGIGITNYHVLDGFTNYYIKKSNGKIYDIIAILESSPPDEYDYVIFQVEKSDKNITPLKIAKHTPEIGEDVFAIGSPKGLENSLTKGTVSSFRQNKKLIQIDATIDHGSSGGPLFNSRGEVIGITTSGIEGSALNFAININKVSYLMD